MSRKIPPPIPVIGANGGSGDTSRENELRAWEQRQQSQREAQAPPATPAAEVAVPAQTAAPAVSATTEETPAAKAVTSVADLPADTAPTAEILSRCEQAIIAARVEAEGRIREVEQTYLATIGPWVRLVHRTKAYKDLKDGTGRPYRSFQRWAQERCGISRAHAYRAVDEGPVAEALASIYTGPLAARQVGVLAPILRQHDAVGVRSVWEAAAATGNTGAGQLASMRDVLALGTQPEDDGQVEKRRTTSESAAALVPLLTAARGVKREEMRQAAQADPEGARSAVMVALRFASDLQQVLEELTAE